MTTVTTSVSATNRYGVVLSSNFSLFSSFFCRVISVLKFYTIVLPSCQLQSALKFLVLHVYNNNNDDD